MEHLRNNRFGSGETYSHRLYSRIVIHSQVILYTTWVWNERWIHVQDKNIRKRYTNKLWIMKDRELEVAYQTVR